MKSRKSDVETWSFNTTPEIREAFSRVASALRMPNTRGRKTILLTKLIMDADASLKKQK